MACCFFIDTAHNVIRYLQKIYHILKPGRLWINFGRSDFLLHFRHVLMRAFVDTFVHLGPLLYHFADMPSEFSLEICWEDIRAAATKIGFKVRVGERERERERERQGVTEEGRDID